MLLEHKPTEADFETMKYPVADDGVPQQPAKPKAKRGRPKQMAPAEEAATPPAEDAAPPPAADEPPAESEDDGVPEEKHEAATNAASSEDDRSEDDDKPESSSDEDDHDDHDDEDESGEDQDPDEEVDINGNKYVVEAIKGHKLLPDGRFKYRISWKGYDETSWEPASPICAKTTTLRWMLHWPRRQQLTWHADWHQSKSAETEAQM